ncbi:MAG: hypothetical protein ACREBU_20925, partial [Nitrososphaera sp.]
LDQGYSQPVLEITLNHPNSYYIPKSVAVHLSNDTSSWGEAVEVYNLDQRSGDQELILPTGNILQARYIKIQVSMWDASDTTWRISELSATTNYKRMDACVAVR